MQAAAAAAAAAARKTAEEEKAADSSSKDRWPAGSMAQVETEDGKELVVVLGLAMEGDKAERRVRFMDGVEDDWEESEFMDPPWQTGTKVDVDTEDGLEQGRMSLLPKRLSADELYKSYVPEQDISAILTMYT